MKNFICETCGVQYESSIEAPKQCLICGEERQFVSSKGQVWTTLEKLIKVGTYSNIIKLQEEGLHSIKTNPSFGIGQTAYLVQDKNYNLLWDCITYIDQSTISHINKLGGIDAIALSHPHYYSSQVEWAETFDAPIYIHEDDKEWVTRTSEKIIFWSGESLELQEGLILQRIGGHYKGGTVLEWKNGSSQKGILLSGDIVRVAADRKWVSFMYSYPNFIPLPRVTVERIADRVNDFTFNRLYDAFNLIIREDADLVVQRSAKRYIEALNGTLFNT
ncbi:MBL fold metallo-hydrolase [Bacillus salipaludis]|uniref:MBL fold metallo-hydrolase n=1 Tax=Bacillus salipaludis TaxID=2547811 RepID=A0A4R5VGP5_9BACI|nr:MBL fold metallo-hydrolase [Bacillus salipaludis]MDQ6597950.1 MBL fold metallo-hydrolase [Bacillus salipaludis]TDK52651.1 MBL fold metallo-hydrolase [Bacillus salipaludis]